MTQWLLHAPSMSFLTSCNRDAHRFYIDVQMCRCDLQRDVGNSANDSRQLRAAQVIVLHGFLPALDAAYENKVFSVGAVCHLGVVRLLKEFAGQDIERQNTWWRNRSSWYEEFPRVPTALGRTCYQ